LADGPLKKNYPMDYFVMLTPHQKPVATVLQIGQWTFHQRFMELSVDQ